MSGAETKLADDSKLGAAIASAFGSFEDFQKQFTTTAAGHFGSGWVWLCADGKGGLVITEGHDAVNPLRDGLTPLMTIDVYVDSFCCAFCS